MEEPNGGKKKFYFIKSSLERSTTIIRCFLNERGILIELDSTYNGNTTLLVQCWNKSELSSLMALEGVSVVDDFECQLIDGSSSDSESYC